MKYVASCSGGKDSLALVLRLIEEKRPLNYVLFYDTGMEFKAIYRNIEKLRPVVEEYGAKFVWLRPDTDFLLEMFCRPINYRDGSGTHYGFDWCGGTCRWRTVGKIKTIQSFLDTIGEYTQYIGIAVDEPQRINLSNNKVYPLVEWNMTEKDCLEYCYSRGWNWVEHDGETEVDLYSIMDRVSCWCCKNSNLKELRNMYHFLPTYWGYLKGMQSRIERPFKGDKTVFQLEERFKEEDSRAEVFDSVFGDFFTI